MKQGDRPEGAEGIKGYFVSSAEIPVHEEHWGVGVPFRIPRKVFRELAKLTAIDLEGKTPDEVMDATDEAVVWMKQLKFYWNWEDEDGTPLDQPANNPEVLEELSIDEINWLLEHISDATTIPPPTSTA